jgi:hypothetical protein
VVGQVSPASCVTAVLLIPAVTIVLLFVLALIALTRCDRKDIPAVVRALSS